MGKTEKVKEVEEQKCDRVIGCYDRTLFGGAHKGLERTCNKPYEGEAQQWKHFKQKQNEVSNCDSDPELRELIAAR